MEVNNLYPLAERMRPQTLEGFLGQADLVGKNKIIRKIIEEKHLFSLIFWGPPGSGKTTLAGIIAKMANAQFYMLSAVSAGKQQLSEVLDKAQKNLSENKKTILFIDEIHRWNKAQQAFLLPFVEKGVVVLIGATTENPSFEIISPLLSRCRVFVLEPLSVDQLQILISKALSDKKEGLGAYKTKLSAEAVKMLLRLSGGDARVLLNALEMAVMAYRKTEIDADVVKEIFQKNTFYYDKKEEEHYNTISSYIKSMRASNVDAALYYLARMVEGGEDPIFIARRMVVFASEDVASPTALVVANSVFRACETVGLPECQENLAAGTVYLAQAKKDRSAYDAYMRALDDVRKYGSLPLPFKLRNAPTKLMKELGYGKDYEMYTNEDLLPEELKGKKYFKP